VGGGGVWGRGAHRHGGWGTPHGQAPFGARGGPRGREEARLTKKALGWPEDRTFWVPDEVLREFGTAIDRGAELEAAWRGRLDAYCRAHAEPARELERALAGTLPEGWEASLPRFTPADGQ